MVEKHKIYNLLFFLKKSEQKSWRQTSTTGDPPMMLVIIFSVEPILKAISSPPSSVIFPFGLMVIVGALWTITFTFASNEQYSPINRIT